MNSFLPVSRENKMSKEDRPVRAYGNVVSVTCSAESAGEIGFDVTVTVSVWRSSAESIEQVVAAVHDGSHNAVVSPETMDFVSETGNQSSGYTSTWRKVFQGIDPCPDHASAEATFTYSVEDESGDCGCT